MFFLKRFIIPLSKPLVICLSFITLSTGNIAVLAATSGSSSNIQAIETGVAAFKTIGTLRKEFPIDADAIAVAYAGALQTLTKEIDSVNNLDLNNDIEDAINDIKNGNQPTLSGQVIDKTLQRVFYQIIWNRIATIRDKFEAETSATLIQMLDEAEASFEGIRKTVARENQVLSADRKAIVAGSNPGLDILISESFSRVRTASSKSNPAEDFGVIQVERYAIRLSLARAYYIAVLREVAGVIKHRDTDVEVTLEKLKEGEIFYRIIESLVARDNPAGNFFINARLTGNASAIEADRIVSELSKGFIGRVKAELKGQENAIGEDRIHAMAEASGAKYFASIFLPDLELRLGVNERSNLENALDNLQTASSENNVSKSEEVHQTILAILTSYESELNLASYDVTNDTALIDNAIVNFQAIGDLRSQIPFDADAIAAKYSGDLQQLTQLVDQVYELSVDQDVLTAINQLKSGNQIPFALQVIDKSLQRIFALVVYNRVTLVTDLFASLSTDELILEWDRAYGAYLAIKKTVDKENKVLTKDKLSIETGSNPDLDYQVLLAFANGKQAFNKTNLDDAVNVAIARENIVIPLVRAFLIGVLREVEGIISNRTNEVDDAREKQVEGEYFYRIVEGFISQDNPSGSNRIKAQLNGDLANVVADQIVSDMSKGIIGQLKRNVSFIGEDFAVDKNQALLASERVSLYTGIFFQDLELRLGTLKRVKMENALRNLKAAILTSDATKALAARSVIFEMISAYETELN